MKIIDQPEYDSPTVENSYQMRPFEDISPDNALHVASTLICTDKHGPGRRFSLWLQECFRRCPGCTNGHMLTSERQTIAPIDQLVAQIKTAARGAAQIDGITLQGGEPVLQARSLSLLIERMRTEVDRDLSVLLFTGYTIEQLQSVSHASVHDLLQRVDTVIDGHFDRTQLDTRLVRGSLNQRIIHLTPRLAGADFSRRGEETVFTFGTQMLRTSGIQYS